MSKDETKPSDPFPELPRRGLFADVVGAARELRRRGEAFERAMEAQVEALPVSPRPRSAELEKALGILLPTSSAVKGSEGGVGAHAADSRMSRSASASRPATGGKVLGIDGDPGPIGPQEGTQSLPSGAKSKGGRPKTVGEPWKATDPPISKAEYYRRKKAGTI